MKIYLLLFMCILSGYSYAQTEATTSEGKTVILATDGTWKYKATPIKKEYASNLETGDILYSSGKVAFLYNSPNISSTKYIIVKENIPMYFDKLIDDIWIIVTYNNKPYYTPLGGLRSVKEIQIQESQGNSFSPPTQNSKPTNSSGSSASVQCSGTTQKGTRCKRMTTASNGRCYQH